MTSERDTTCPNCGRVNQLHSGPTPGAMPAPGDVSICWSCRSLSVYTADFDLRVPTEEESLQFEGSADLAEARRAIASANTPSQANKQRWVG